MEKEKRAPSRLPSLLVAFEILTAMLFSCTVVLVLGTANPWSGEAYFSIAAIDTTNNELGFFTSPGKGLRPSGYYNLDQDDHIICEWRSYTEGYPPERISQRPVQSLTHEQLASLEDRYGKINNYTVVSSDITALVTDHRTVFGQLYGTRLIIIKNETPDAPVIVDAETLYWVNVECDQSQPYLILHGFVLITSVIVAVVGIRTLHYKNIWLLIYMILLCLSLLFGYFLVMA